MLPIDVECLRIKILPDKEENVRFSPFLKIFTNVHHPTTKFLTPSLRTVTTQQIFLFIFRTFLVISDHCAPHPYSKHRKLHCSTTCSTALLRNSHITAEVGPSRRQVNSSSNQNHNNRSHNNRHRKGRAIKNLDDLTMMIKSHWLSGIDNKCFIPNTKAF